MSILDNFTEPLLGTGAGLAGGAALGAGVGLLGGPFDFITVPAGALIGGGLGGAGGFAGGLFSQNTSANKYISQQNAISQLAGAQAQQAVTTRTGILAALPGATAQNVGSAVNGPVTTTTQTTKDLSTPGDFTKYIVPLLVVAGIAVAVVLLRK